MTGYTKLFGSIITSTIWREDKETKILWITMLALKDKNGIVEGSVPGLADMARLTLEETEASLQKLRDPDPHSRTKDHDGRRIEDVDGGWLILNHDKWRRKMNEDERREYNRIKQAEHRAKVSKTVSKHKQMSALSAHTDADTDAKKKKKAPVKPVPPFNVEDWLTELEKDPTYKGLNIRAEFGKCRNWCAIRKLTLSKKRFVNWINRADIPLASNGAAKVTYKRNYLPPAREPTAEEIEKARAIAKAEADKFRASQGRSP